MNGKVSINYEGISLEHYANYISMLRNRGHKFLTAENFLKLKSGVFWRHDIDYSIDASLTLSQIENELGVCATYYVDLNTYFYNALSVANIEKINLIYSQGHDIGLHFDAQVLTHSSDEELHEKIGEYSNTFSQHFGIKPKSFTFHRPNQITEKFTLLRYGGLINCYSPTFMAIGNYCSDSNGHWRHKTLLEAVQDEPPFHILTHPGWWGLNQRAPRNRIIDIVLGEASKIQNTYDQDMLRDRRKNIGLSSAGQVGKTEKIEIKFLVDCLLSLGQKERDRVIASIVQD